MRTVSFKSVLEGVARKMAIPPDELSTEDASDYAEYISERIKEAWEYDFWPEICLCEERAYRDTWASGTTYAAEAELYFAGLYYSANSAPNTPTAGQSPATHPAKWTELTSYERYVAWEQTGHTVIGTVQGVFKNNPRVVTTRPAKVRFTPTDLGIMPSSEAGATVWIEFRTLAPVFTTTEWDGAEANAVGDVRYRPTTGDCWKALQASTNKTPESEPAYWERVKFPMFLASAVKVGAYADALNGDEQNDKGAAKEANFWAMLAQLGDTVLAQQGQYQRADVETY